MVRLYCMHTLCYEGSVTAHGQIVLGEFSFVVNLQLLLWILLCRFSHSASLTLTQMFTVHNPLISERPLNSLLTISVWPECIFRGHSSAQSPVAGLLIAFGIPVHMVICMIHWVLAWLALGSLALFCLALTSMSGEKKRGHFAYVSKEQDLMPLALL